MTFVKAAKMHLKEELKNLKYHKNSPILTD